MTAEATFRGALARVHRVDEKLYQRALARHAALTKPPGSLGALEPLGARLAAVLGTLKPRPEGRAVAVFAADHGVAAAGVSAYPQSVTAGMVRNFLAGGAAVNALAAAAGAKLLIVDVGVAADVDDHPALWSRKVARGTRNMLHGPAMTRAELFAACAAGVEAAEHLAARGAVLLAGGEMGIGNTTAAAALTAHLTGAPARAVTGRGSGLDDAGLARKVAVVEQVLERHGEQATEPLEALRRFGGLEIAALTGFYVGAAALRAPVVLDGFIATAAALVAAALAPAVRDYLFAAHRSQEPGHAVQLQHLGLTPLFDLGLRLGEGSGAVLAFGLLEGAAAVLRDMATFEEAGL
ncbi:nicotinate-nucleotide--dimethylbenzimidazole phosphoribosyltransferase [Truepera radiovictrix]|uniref:Nicotinate-nucleotide--dimethylbenzimidazole phosphoribosyltransferase n=1 Tax=Truepera radiovictrix (strain DSM 17093 / CIP 108686 / LMG 22925 / RQ-24) TaxID=649638 RepID=D7CRM4_TRURR|nr:nicotinate-nucleotide--dimethylbenzimidazole phosphoribosyltransferase [Truepera radiovictrix]ADI13514.1 nicotinate-nucleotide/dimethylbenzimidazole phosphoribosyltransferase [Truepera radiovictrix DSM 17093]WMT57924.1 nicotinate-nucleotide--dimethylbenzimidazole phosphoribosyltransferase [Truepera radiovictrix]